eukprot:gnl/Trimastix_PCT/3480.p1 GENE.gnl/Trimastix_PCT/3480~~gnl/Trimastix_PCT/3480.p1  ORF type:complete len:208 (-),score=26.81 gnl/Trimastix_PCT/3480:46-597(-)
MKLRSTPLCVVVRQTTPPYFSDRYDSYHLSGLLSESEFIDIITDLNQTIQSHSPNAVLAFIGILCCPCTCGIPLYFANQTQNKLKHIIAQHVRLHNERLGEAGLELHFNSRTERRKVKVQTAGGQKQKTRMSVTETWLEFRISPEARARVPLPETGEAASADPARVAMEAEPMVPMAQGTSLN